MTRGKSPHHQIQTDFQYSLDRGLRIEVVSRENHFQPFIIQNGKVKGRQDSPIILFFKWAIRGPLLLYIRLFKTAVCKTNVQYKFCQ